MERRDVPLHALVEPAGTVLLGVDGDGERLPATIVDGVYERDIELVRMLSELVRAGHARRTGANNENALYCWGRHW